MKTTEGRMRQGGGRRGRDERIPLHAKVARAEVLLPNSRPSREALVIVVGFGERARAVMGMMTAVHGLTPVLVSSGRDISSWKRCPDVVAVAYAVSAKASLKAKTAAIRRIRHALPAAHLLVITDTGRSGEERVALENGADDFTCRLEDLLCRFNVLLYRASRMRTARDCADSGVHQPLTDSESKALRELARKREITFREVAVDVLGRGPGNQGNAAAVRQLFCRLRRKLGSDATVIRPVRGVGYRLIGELSPNVTLNPADMPVPFTKARARRQPSTVRAINALRGLEPERSSWVGRRGKLG
jgi:hypothetical protein